MKMKSISLILLLIIMLATVISCDSAIGDTLETTIASAETGDDTTESSSEDTKITDDLPSDLNFNGEAVTFLYREEIAEEFYVDMANGDIVNDALYDSIRMTEERLNVDIVTVKRAGHYTSARDEYMNHITQTVLAGDDVYDWVDLMIGNTPNLMVNGIFANLLDNMYIDLDKPWYLFNLADTVAINDALYFVAGDVSLGYLKCAFCMYFNKDLMIDYNIEDLYSVVDSGGWTISKLQEIAKIASADINSDGVYNLEDKLGFVQHDYNHTNGFIGSCEFDFFTKNSDGQWEYTFGNERDEAVSNKIYQLLFETEGAYRFNGTNAVTTQLEDYNKIASKFVAGEILIMTAELDDAVSQLRNMEDEYGILPYPKYEESQTDYYTCSRSTHSAFSMPITCDDRDMAGAVLEALSSSNYNLVIPTYFEVALKVKYATDVESARMYDMIRDGMVLDFGYIFNNILSEPMGAYMVTTGASGRAMGNFTSTLESKRDTIIVTWEKYLEKIESNREN